MRAALRVFHLVTMLICGAAGHTLANERASFWVWDLTVMPPGFRRPEFTESAVLALSHDRLHVWVENGLGDRTPSQAALEKLVPLYARAIELERPIFGDQPVSPSGDRDIHLVIADIPPYEKHGKKFGFDGFFNVFDQLTEEAALAQGQHSNERDIIYVNALQDVTSEYMKGVVAHELNHLLTSARFDAAANPLDPWLNEMLAEAAMQLGGYYTDGRHVDAYRALPEEPLAVDGYGISYGGISLFAEYLMNAAPPDRLGQVAPATGDGFKRVAEVYGSSWNALFEGYVTWLFQGRSAFFGTPVSIRAPQPAMRVAPTGIIYLSADADLQTLKITATPKTCAADTHVNVLRKSQVVRYGRDRPDHQPAQVDVPAQAVWVESTPPCAVTKGGEDFDGFTVSL